MITKKILVALLAFLVVQVTGSIAQAGSYKVLLIDKSTSKWITVSTFRDATSMETGWNDRVEAITLAVGSCITIYEHERFKGQSLPLCNLFARSEKTFDLTKHYRTTGSNWSRETSSYKVSASPPKN